jgi:hypothetical protein
MVYSQDRKDDTQCSISKGIVHMSSVHALKSVLYAGVMLAFAIVGLGVGTAQAATTFTGFTDGCFGLACDPPSAPGPQSATLAGLTYVNSTFNVTEAGGFAAIGNAPASPNFDNLGSFVLTGAPFTYTGSVFDLRVTFTAPPGTAPSTLVFTSSLTGAVTAINNGGVFVDFNNAPQHFTFTGGSFDLVVNDVSMTAGNTVPVTGQIVSVVTGVPEPETYAMMLAGLGLMGFVVRRRGKTAA